MSSYEEQRARYMNDPTFCNFLRRFIREEMQHGMGRLREGCAATASGIPPGYISIAEAAGLVDYKPRSVHDLVQDGFLDSLKIGQVRYVERTAFLRHVLHHAKMRQREKALALLGGEQMSHAIGAAVNG